MFWIKKYFGFVFQFEDSTGALPDPSLPVAHQLEFALGKIREHIRTIVDTQAACKSLAEVQFSSPVQMLTVTINQIFNILFGYKSLPLQKLKEKEAALWRAEQNIVSRDKVINELRLRLPAAADRERLLADVSKHEEAHSDYQPALKLAHQTIKDLQGRLDKKEEGVKKYQSQLAQARQVWGVTPFESGVSLSRALSFAFVLSDNSLIICVTKNRCVRSQSLSRNVSLNCIWCA